MAISAGEAERALEQEVAMSMPICRSSTTACRGTPRARLVVSPRRPCPRAVKRGENAGNRGFPGTREELSACRSGSDTGDTGRLKRRFHRKKSSRFRAARPREPDNLSPSRRAVVPRRFVPRPLSSLPAGEARHSARSLKIKDFEISAAASSLLRAGCGQEISENPARILP